MQRYTFIIIILTAFFGCNDYSNENDSYEDKLLPKIKIDTLIDISQEIQIDTFSVPSKQLIKVVSFLDSLNFIHDTIRIKKVPYYWERIKSSKIFIIKTIPFFKMDTLSNPIFYYLYRNSNNKFKSSKNSRNYRERNISKKIIKERIFNKVKNITGFYFRDKTIPNIKKGELWTDGFIDEWEFDNIDDTKKAEETLINENLYRLIYFNSIAFVHRQDNYLYTYYSRSSWATKRMNKVFEEIIYKQNNL